MGVVEIIISLLVLALLFIFLTHITMNVSGKPLTRDHDRESDLQADRYHWQQARKDSSHHSKSLDVDKDTYWSQHHHASYRWYPEPTPTPKTKPKPTPTPTPTVTKK